LCFSDPNLAHSSTAALFFILFLPSTRYQVTVEAGAAVTISTCGGGTTLNTVLSYGTDPSCGQCSGSADDSCGVQSELYIDATNVATTYYVLVSGAHPHIVGTYTLTVTCGAPTERTTSAAAATSSSHISSSTSAVATSAPKSTTKAPSGSSSQFACRNGPLLTCGDTAVGTNLLGKEVDSFCGFSFQAVW
jgi:hypothetical protein